MTRPGGQRLLFSATLDRGVDRLARAYLTDPVAIAVASAASPVESMDHLAFTVRHEDKVPVLSQIVGRPARTLIFVRTKHGADRLARQLSREGTEAGAIHGNLAQNARQRALDAFAAGRTRVLVATDVAARGIHVDDVDLVVHYDPPADHKDYLHRSGRTARAGAKARCCRCCCRSRRATRAGCSAGRARRAGDRGGAGPRRGARARPLRRADRGPPRSRPARGLRRRGGRNRSGRARAAVRAAAGRPRDPRPRRLTDHRLYPARPAAPRSAGLAGPGRLDAGRPRGPAARPPRAASGPQSSQEPTTPALLESARSAGLRHAGPGPGRPPEASPPRRTAAARARNDWHPSAAARSRQPPHTNPPLGAAAAAVAVVAAARLAGVGRRR